MAIDLILKWLIVKIQNKEIEVEKSDSFHIFSLFLEDYKVALQKLETEYKAIK